jgi:DNA modification methylase
MLGRKWIGVDISPNYCEVARNRIHTYQLEQEQLQIVIDEVKKD